MKTSFSPEQQTFWQALHPSAKELAKGLVTGIAIGIVVPTIINPLEKANTNIQLNRLSETYYRAVLKHPLKGVKVAIASAMTKNILLFGARPVVYQLANRVISNPEVSGICASVGSTLFMSFSLSPLQFFKTRIHTQNETTIKEVWANTPKTHRMKLLFAGSGLTACQNTLYWPTFLAINDFTNHQLKERNVNSVVSSLISGYAGALAANTVAYPLSVVVKSQKDAHYSTSSYETAKKILLEAGFKGFFRGYGHVQLTRVLIAGPVTSFVIYRVDKLFQEKK